MQRAKKPGAAAGSVCGGRVAAGEADACLMAAKPRADAAGLGDLGEGVQRSEVGVALRHSTSSVPMVMDMGRLHNAKDAMWRGSACSSQVPEATISPRSALACAWFVIRASGAGSAASAGTVAPKGISTITATAASARTGLHGAQSGIRHVGSGVYVRIVTATIG